MNIASPRRPLAITLAALVALALALCAVAAAGVGQAHAATPKPAKAVVSSFKSKAAGEATVAVKKAKNAKGYQYAVSQSKKFTGGTTKKAKAAKRSYTFKKLAQGKKYYVKARAYSKKGNTVKWGKWSGVKSVTVKGASSSTPTTPTSPGTPATPGTPDASGTPSLAYIYVDAGKRAAEATEWDEATKSYVGKKLYELYIDESSKAPVVGGSYKGGTVASVQDTGRSTAYPAYSVTLLVSAKYGELSLPSFQKCTTIDLSKCDVSNVTDMENMFEGCSSLASLDVSGWDTRNVTRMDSMFEGCSSLASLDVSGWDTRNVTYMYDMFYGCSSLASLKTGATWDTNIDSGKPRFPCAMQDESGTVFRSDSEIPDGAHTYTAVTAS